MDFQQPLFTVWNHVDDANLSKIAGRTDHGHRPVPVIADKKDLLAVAWRSSYGRARTGCRQNQQLCYLMLHFCFPFHFYSPAIC